ncbi:hypothetical protein GRI39_09840 [Altererythrobacter indicus]|uniref:EF-hand domain-containing protein n=1 Tax=Altericroceibacterium indicum TaxID=374177 RepID=A0A845AA03_9SPHN|nr:EF-hand domain-containing protein [Altericroceibacterium indicum]MXP26337.1 hypothetical protein [Altericroceibacterium indicum]
MRKLIISLAAAAVAIAGGSTLAYAQPKMGGDFTRSQAQERATKMFERMDVNSDGVIDAADREARMKQRFDKMDTDKNGSISFAEFSARPEWKGKRGHHRMGRGGHGPMGMMADTDKDGKITRAEFQAHALAKFDAMDTDKNGTVTAAERKADRDAMRAKFSQQREARANIK